MGGFPRNWDFPVSGAGCGSGTVKEWLATAASKFVFRTTGDPNEPVEGFSFLPACDVHDACYDAQTSRATCDNNISIHFDKICNNNQECLGAGEIMSGIIRNKGEDAYVHAGKVKICKEIQKDAKNNCSDTGVNSGI